MATEGDLWQPFTVKTVQFPMRTTCLTGILLITIIAIVAFFFAVTSINLNGMYSSDITEADLIRQRCPIHIVQPEWVSLKPDLLGNWMEAEMKARIGLVIALWMGIVSFIVWRYRSKRKSMTLVQEINQTGSI